MLHESITHAWPPFVLVTGLLLIGGVAHQDGLFARAGQVLERLPGRPVVLFACGALLVTAVTAVLNLDTAVVFLTPVLLLSARHRGADEQAFLYMPVFMANAGSLFLPGSNLTNLIVLGDNPLAGGNFAGRFLAPAAAAAGATLVGLLLLFGRRLQTGTLAPVPASSGPWLGTGLAAAIIAAVLTVALADPALPVFAVAAITAVHAVWRGRLTRRELVDAVSPLVLAGIFVVAVALGVLARSWDGPANLVANAGRIETVGLGALGSVMVNNLPASVLLSAQSVPHPRALLIGLNLGPNLAVTGSLSAYLWMQSARQVGASPSAIAFTRRGLMLAPTAMVAALLVSNR